MDPIFNKLPNNLIIDILRYRKEIKRDERYKKQFKNG